MPKAKPSETAQQPDCVAHRLRHRACSQAEYSATGRPLGVSFPPGTISRDLLLLTRVDKPTLLRRLFQLGCSYSGQILSYTKMLGQLQDAGNTTALAHYLDLLAGAGILFGLPR